MRNESSGGGGHCYFFYPGKKKGGENPHNRISEIHPFLQVSNFTGNSQEINSYKIPIQALFQVDKTNLSSTRRAHVKGELKQDLFLHGIPHTSLQKHCQTRFLLPHVSRRISGLCAGTLCFEMPPPMERPLLPVGASSHPALCRGHGCGGRDLKVGFKANSLQAAWGYAHRLLLQFG